MLQSKKHFASFRPPRKQSRQQMPFHDTGKGYYSCFRNSWEEAAIEYWTFEESRDWLRPYKFPSKFDYKQYAYHSYQQLRYGGNNYYNRNGIECPPKPPEIPDDIDHFYKDQWTTSEEFFIGDLDAIECFRSTTNKTGTALKIYYKFEYARAYVRSIGFKTIEDFIFWEDSSKKPTRFIEGHLVHLPSGKTVIARPKFIPSNPHFVYFDDWVCLQDYIGLPYTYLNAVRRKPKVVPNNIANLQSKGMLSYEEAREFVRTCRFSSSTEYLNYYKHDHSTPFVTKLGQVLPPCPKCLPSRPQDYYTRFSKIRNSWNSWYDFLGLKYNNKHDQELEDLMKKAQHVHYKKSYHWVRENNIKELGYRVNPYVRRKMKSNEWDGWYDVLNRHNNSGYCPFEDAKILLSFKNLNSINQYNNWRTSVGSPFFLPTVLDEDHLPIIYPDVVDTSVSNFLSIDLGDKIETQAKATPLLAITIIKEQTIMVDIVKAGKFDAFIRYHNKPSCYVFDFFDKNMWAQMLNHHCEPEYGGNIYYVKHMGMLYQDLNNNFRRMNLARIYDK